jgi:hypothetical protein
LRFVFVKRFNPAYDILALRYFQQNGIDVDSSLTNERADALVASLPQKPDRSMAERQFSYYLSLWSILLC